MNIIIHTIEIINEITNTDLGAVLDTLNFPRHKKICILYAHSNRQHNILAVSRRCIILDHPQYGIKVVRVLYMREGNIARYYLILQIELNHMLTGERQMQLFQCTPDNLRTLHNNFTTALHDLLPQFPIYHDMASWNARRIDYTFDFKFPSRNESDLFLELSKHSSRYIRTKLIRDDDLKIKDQSHAEVNKSTKSIFYDKEKQVREVYRGIPNDKFNNLIKGVANTIRFEVQCNSRKINSIKSTSKIPLRRIIYFLREDIAVDLLLKRYHHMVGAGDFWTYYHAEKIINDSDNRPSTKQTLINTLRMIAQARHIDIARKQFVNGVTLGKTKDKIIMQGSVATFDNRVGVLRQVGVNPVLIPRDYSTRTHITHLANPLSQLQAYADSIVPLPIDIWYDIMGLNSKIADITPDEWDEMLDEWLFY